MVKWNIKISKIKLKMEEDLSKKKEAAVPPVIRIVWYDSDGGFGI